MGETWYLSLNEIKWVIVDSKKSLKIPKGQSESVYVRRTDNTKANRKRTKGQTYIQN
jgi:hypothetical protein